MTSAYVIPCLQQLNPAALMSTRKDTPSPPSHVKGPKAIFLSKSPGTAKRRLRTSKYTARGEFKAETDQGPRCHWHRTTASPLWLLTFPETGHQIRMELAFFIPSWKATSWRVHFLWCVYTRTEGHSRNPFGAHWGGSCSHRSCECQMSKEPTCATESSPCRIPGTSNHVWEFLTWGLFLAYGKNSLIFKNDNSNKRSPN